MQRQRQHWFVANAPWLLTVLLGLLMSFAVVRSVALANWARGLNIMVPVALGAALVAAVFGRMRWLPGWLAHLLSAALGIAWTVQQVGPQLGAGLDTWRDRATELLIRAIILGRIVSKGGVGDDLLLFITLLALLAWALAYATVWMLTRHGWAWWVVLLNAVVLFVNLTYASPKPPIIYFFLFLSAALIVIVQQTYLQRATTWEAAQMEYPDFLGWRFVASGVMVVLVLLALTTLLPTRITTARVAHLWQQVREPWQQVQARWDRTFSNINAPANAAGGGFSGKSFTLTGARTLGNGLVMEVEAARFDYWRAVALDRYNGKLSWSNTTGDLARAALGRETAEDASTPLDARINMPLLDTEGREVLTQTFILRQSFSVPTLFAATQPVSFSLPVLAEHTYIQGNGTQLANFTDASMFRAQQTLREGTRYTVASLVPSIDKTSLRNTPTDYTEWVQRYLQLPPNMSQRVRDKAHEIVTTANATTAYDKAEAIQAFLRTFPYDEKIPSPPDDRDVMEYFIFELQRGYCDYFASAMVLMLRAEGVPARIAQGYAGGEFNTQTGRYEVRQNVAHTWPEVYFPGYGWQRFEPTPASYARGPQRLESPQTGDDRAAPPTRMNNRDLEEENLLDLEREIREQANQPFTPNQASAALDQHNAAVAAQQRLMWQQRGVVGTGVVAALVAGVWVFRRRSPLTQAAEIYGRLLRWAHWAGLGSRASATPHEVALSLGRHLPQQQSQLDVVASAYTREQYAANAGSPPAELHGSWRALRWPLIGAVLSRFTRPPRRSTDRRRR